MDEGSRTSSTIPSRPRREEESEVHTRGDKDKGAPRKTTSTRTLVQEDVHAFIDKALANQESHQETANQVRYLRNAQNFGVTFFKRNSKNISSSAIFHPQAEDL